MAKRVAPFARGMMVLLATALVLASMPASVFAVPGLTISGTVYNASGAPATGSDWKVEVYAGTQTLTGVLDGAGAYQVSGIPAATECFVRVYNAADSRYDAQRGLGVLNADTPNVDFDFRPAITGKVVSATTAAALKDVAVTGYVKDASGNWVVAGFASTAADGTYELSRAELGTGAGSTTYRVGYDAIGYKAEYFNDKSSLELADSVVFDGTSAAVANAALTPEPVSRIAGSNRFDTSALIGSEFVAGDWSGVIDVIIASGEDRAAADPLSAAGLSWVYGGCPIFLVKSTAVSTEVKETILDMVAANPGKQIAIHVVGGTASVPDARVTEIKSYVGAANVTADRVNGANRYDVARLIAEQVKESWIQDFGAAGVPGVLVANGADPNKFFDALSMSAVSASTGMPILLVSATSVPSATQAAAKSMGALAGSTYIAGGTATVSESVRKALSVAPGNRLAGATRFSTARIIADTGLSKGWFESDTAGVAAKLPDALAGGAAVGAMGGPLLLTKTDSLPAETVGYITAHKATLKQVYVFGGEASVYPAVATQLTKAMQ